MKKLLLAATLLACTAFAANAQDGGEIGYGIKAGGNLSNLVQGDSVTDNNARIGYHAGVYLKFGVTDWLFIQPELLYTSMGGRFSNSLVNTQSNYANTYQLDYIQLPVMLMFRAAKTVRVSVGPSVSYLVRGVRKLEQNNVESKITNRDQFQDFDYGVNGGLGVEFGKLNVSARYYYGLAEIEKDGFSFNNNLLKGSGVSNSVAMLSLGYEL